MVESWKITLIIEKSPVPSKAASLLSKYKAWSKISGRHGGNLRFPPTPRKTASRTHLQAQQRLCRKPACVWGEWMPVGGGVGGGGTVEFHTEQLLCFVFHT